MKNILFIIPALLLGACAGTKNTVAIDTQYTVNQIAEQKIDTNNPTITFGADGKIFGSTGCNRYFGEYSIKGDEISIAENMGSTRMMCHDSMDIEQAFLQVMPKVVKISQKANELTLTTADGKVMVAVKEAKK